MKQIQRIIVFVIPLAVLIFALSQLIPILMDYRKADASYERLTEVYVSETPSDEKQKESDMQWWASDVQIDFEKLKQENPNIIGWIRFDNTDQVAVDYPILYSGEDETYLHKNYEGEEYKAGSIFLEGLNQPDMNDLHQIIYGHNMKDGSMFGALKKYKQEEDFLVANGYFTIYTPDMVYRYQIFSFHDVDEADEVYTVGYHPGEEYDAFVGRLLEASIEQAQVMPEEGAPVVTLSTCSSAGEEKRFVLHAVCVDAVEP